MLLGVVTVATKFATGWWAAGRMGSEPRARGVVGAALVPRGEFSIAIAGLATAAAIEDDLGPVTVAYVIFTVVVGSGSRRSWPVGWTAGVRRTSLSATDERFPEGLGRSRT